MQALFAHSFKPYEAVTAAEADLIRTVKNCYPLFIWLFSIFPELTYYRSNKLEDLKGKHIPTQEDLNPNTKFVDNKVIAQIEQNVTLRKLISQYHINWSEDTDFIVKLFHIIEEMPEYKKYMETREGTYDEDKKLVLDIIQNIFIEDEHMRWFFGEKDVNWLDDYDEALMMLYMNISDFKQAKGDDCKILTLFKNTREDERFCRTLFLKTLENDAEYEKMIRDYGMIIDTAESGREAIDKYIKEEYDVIFMDHMMPEMDGVEAMKRLKHLAHDRGTSVPVVALTANVLSGAREMSALEGFNGFISKPIDIMEFERVMNKLDLSSKSKKGGRL